MADYPTSVFNDLDSDFLDTEHLDEAHGNFGHVEAHNALRDEIKAVQEGLGTGASNATPTANKVRRATGTGTAEWGQVATGDVATDAITQADAVSATDDIGTTSTSFVDMTNMTKTLTVTGGDVYVRFTGAWYIVGAAVVKSLSAVDSVGGAHASKPDFNQGTGNMVESVSHIWKFAAPAAGSRTFKIQWKTGSGTLRIIHRCMEVWERKK